MKAIRLITYAALLSVFFTNAGCKKSDKCCDFGPNPEYTPDYVTATIAGRVTDDNNVPVNGAAVKAGSLTATTDVNGNFTIANASLDKQAGFVKVEKDGFFQGSRTVNITAGATHNVTIQLIKKTVAGTVNSTSGGSVTVPSGGTISFTDNSFVNPATNMPYSGSVSVSAFLINPTASNIKEIMPGALRGITNNYLVGLKSYGMMAVELTGASGEKLQLATGKQATITFPIPATLQTQAPTTINLWSFDDATGLWKQENTATKDGNNYIAKVGHFSFWNCDDPFPIVDFKALLKDKNGNIIPSARVVLKIKDATNDETDGYADNNGVVSGPVPFNKSLAMTVYNTCGTLIHTQDIGPFTANTDIGVLTINTVVPASATITGTVVNCTGNLVATGQVDITLNNKVYRAAITNGSFSFSIDRCDNSTLTAKLQAYDFTAAQQGAETSISVGTGNINVGQLSACGSTINEYINYFFGTQITLIPPDDLSAELRNDTTSIVGTPANQLGGISSFTFKGTAAPGTKEMTDIYFIYNQNSWRKSGAVNVIVTEYGAVGGYVSGNFSGNVVRTGTSTLVPITGRFRVKRIS